MVRAFVLLFVMALSASTVRGEWGVSAGVPSWNDKPGSFLAAGALLSLDADAAKYGAFQCSGNLIAPKAFLTVIHCVLIA
jgi:hypothetical protein